jgi:putative transposase
MVLKAANEKPVTKTDLAKQSGVSVSSLYYKPLLPQKDWLLKQSIEDVLEKHPSYGHKRLALELNINKKRVRRVMKLFGLLPYRRKPSKPNKHRDNGMTDPFPNLLQSINFPSTPGVVWVSDFTHLKWHGKWVYLSTIMDIFNRKVVGWSVLTNHSVQLTITALIDANEKHGRPQILHSDQGSEYKSKVYTQFVGSLGINQSMSRKASPWQNGYQESFYSGFKTDFGSPEQYNSLGELTAAIYLQIHYYNNKRIHSKLKMPPMAYAQRHQLQTNLLPIKS